MKGYRVSVWEDENILEMGDDDGWPTIGMYLIQLNLTPRGARERRVNKPKMVEGEKSERPEQK